LYVSEAPWIASVRIWDTTSPSEASALSDCSRRSRLACIAAPLPWLSAWCSLVRCAASHASGSSDGVVTRIPELSSADELATAAWFLVVEAAATSISRFPVMRMARPRR
jgi:hypothetical protein